MSALLSPNRATAQAWLDADVPVFPVGPDKLPLFKWRPRTEEGQAAGHRTRPLTVAEAEAAWLRRGARDAMPGLDCQAIGAIVIDLDAKNNGIENFETLCRERGIDLDDAFCVRTPTGGVHYYFADPTGRWRNSTSKLAVGVDTRGLGGYVVAPGALRRGVGVYEPVRPATLPEFIAAIARGLE